MLPVKNKKQRMYAQAKCELVLSLGTRYMFIEERKGGVFEVVTEV